MKKAVLATLALTLFTLLVVGQGVPAAGDTPAHRTLPPPLKIENTVWKGSVTYVENKNGTTTTTTSENCTITIGDRVNNFFAGKYEDPVTPSNSFDFSGIIGPLNRRFLHIGGTDHVAFADVVRPGIGQLFFRGHNTLTGVSYMGVLQREQTP